MIKWLKSHKFAVHTLSFLLMLIPPAGMLYAARAGSDGLILALLALVVAGNLLTIISR